MPDNGQTGSEDEPEGPDTETAKSDGETRGAEEPSTPWIFQDNDYARHSLVQRAAANRATQSEWDAMVPHAERLFQAARHSQYAHYAEGDALNARHQRFGIWAAALAVISGTSALTHLSKAFASPTVNLVIETAQGLIALGAGVLSTLQTKLNYAKSADTHRHAAVEYGAIRRSMTTMFQYPLWMRDDLREYFEYVQKYLRDLASQSPEISKSVWAETELRLKKDPSSLMNG